MGQYWLPVNLDKKEYINPHKLGSGLKIREQIHTHPGTCAALLMLVTAQREIRGGGDFQMSEDEYLIWKTEGPHRTDCTPVPREVIGRWAGDRIAIVGDYAEDSDLAEEHEASTIYNRCHPDDPLPNPYTDITDIVCDAIEAEFQIEFSGDGWRDWKSVDETEETEMKRGQVPDMVISVPNE